MSCTLMSLPRQSAIERSHTLVVMWQRPSCFRQLLTVDKEHCQLQIRSTDSAPYPRIDREEECVDKEHLSTPTS